LTAAAAAGVMLISAGALTGGAAMADRALELQLRGFGLTTAEILYRLPDHQSLLQTYIWQDYDLFPKLPKLLGFLQFWSKNLDGPLHKVRVAHQGLIQPHEFTYRDGRFVVH
jgi:uncharacterized protein Usg